MSNKPELWPNGARLCVSLAMQFEAGGQPISGAGGPITEPIEEGFPDLGTNSWFDYGVREGIPRLLDLFDKHGLKVTSFMVAKAVEREPELAREIVERGHEAAAHGFEWAPQYNLPEADERKLIRACIDSIERATGSRPSGYDCYWMRGSVRTLSLLQELAFTYHNNDLNMDEPWIQDINGKPFVSVPYTVHLNDIVAYDHVGFSPIAYEQQLKDEFDQLYEEGARRRRMMVVSLHDRLSGHASRVRSLERFLVYAKGHTGVWFARKDEIAQHALATPDVTPKLQRGLAESTGWPANTLERA
ncbi:polysaccharide deacetylase family protein [Roseateles sp. NT4]|uniref:polysaccharide deacetylase family protein n=1 Tax=Roseateles sp. NT4 TaxID=3453715 RepID=UPI003EECE337